MSSMKTDYTYAGTATICKITLMKVCRTMPGMQNVQNETSFSFLIDVSFRGTVLNVSLVPQCILLVCHRLHAFVGQL